MRVLGSTLRSWHNIPTDEWPSQEDALAVIAALATRQASTWGELEATSGVANVARFIGHAYRVYGFPELEDGRVMRALHEAVGWGTSAEPEAAPEVATTSDTYGFTPRA